MMTSALCLLAALLQDKSYDLNVEWTPVRGHRAEVVETTVMTLSATVGGKPLDQRQEKTLKAVEEILDVAAGGTVRRRLTFLQARSVEAGKPKPFSFEGKSVLLTTAKGTPAVYAPDGPGVLGEEEKAALRGFPPDADAGDGAAALWGPKGPVRAGESWTLPPEALVSLLGDAGLPFDPARSKGVMKLEAVEIRDAHEHARLSGILEVAVNAFGEFALDPHLPMTTTMTGEAVIGGRLPDVLMRMDAAMKGRRALRGGAAPVELILDMALTLRAERRSLRPRTPGEATAEAERRAEEAGRLLQEGQARQAAVLLLDARFEADRARAEAAKLPDAGALLARIDAILRRIDAARIAAPAIAPAADRRTPPPDAAAQKAEEKKLQDRLKAEYAKKAPADQQALARKLLDLGRQEAGGSALQWALLEEARELAEKSGEFSVLTEALKLAVETFQVDAMAHRVASLTAAAKAVKTLDDAGAFGAAVMELTREAWAADSYDAAEKALAAAQGAARRANDPLFAGRLAARAKEMSDLRTRFDRTRRARELDAAGTVDAAAQLELGQFYAFFKRDWPKGLAHLARGSDPALRAAAENELAQPADAATQLQIADTWWAAGEKDSTEPRRRHLFNRATYWYDKAVAGLEGPALLRAEKRIEAHLRTRLKDEGLRCVPSHPDLDRSLSARPWEDGGTIGGSAHGRSCVQLTPNPRPDNHRYLYFDVLLDWSEGWRPVEVEIEYFDGGGGWFDLEYDGPGNAYKNAGRGVTIGNTGTWKAATFLLLDAQFKGRQNANADFRIRRGPSADFLIHQVVVRLAGK